MKLVLEISGEDSVLNQGLDFFVKQNGWTEDNQTGKIKFAEEVLRHFIRENIQAYAVKDAISTASTTAQNQINSILDTASTVLKEI